MRRIAIDEFLKESKNALLLDVRSPAEYKHAHIPGAINLPLFTDEERKVIGTTYKQVSQQSAIKIGLDYFGPKMRGMIEEVEKMIEQRSRRTEEQGTDEGREYRTCDQRIMNVEEERTSNIELQTINSKLFLYCWRGGMRSGAVGWLLNLYGFNVTVLAGGYKTFRNWVLQTNAYPYRLKLIGGYTGSGKTALLKELEKRGELIVDLEKLASHKGSAFGNIGMPPQPTQEMFENLLATTMADQYARAKACNTPHEIENGVVLWPQKPILIEDESQRIGLINIPQPFWQNMRRSPVFFLDIPFDERLKNVVAEYGSLDKERMASAIQRIAKRLGPMETKTALQLLQEDNITECFRILLQYYDKQYVKGLHNRESLASVLTKINCEKVTVDNAALLSQAQAVI